MKPAESASSCWRWVRHVSAAHEDAWRERLADAGPALAVTGRPGSRVARLEVYDTSAAPLRGLARQFGGMVERIDHAAIVARANAPRKPVRIARDFVVLDAAGRLPAGAPRPRIVLRVGAAMAFGTGDHATTASCLRLMHGLAAELPPGWTALDVGTGSGILAVAAEKLGAARVMAFDNDGAAVRAAMANARRNRCSRIVFETRDLLRGRATAGRHALVLANVYSTILVEAAPRLVRSVAPGGFLVISGILRGQLPATLDAFAAEGLEVERRILRGKWATALLRRPA